MATSLLLNRAQIGGIAAVLPQTSSHGVQRGHIAALPRMPLATCPPVPLCPGFSLLSGQVSPSIEQLPGRRRKAVARATVSEKTDKQVTTKDVEEWNKKGKIQRLEHLEEQALETLRHALYDFERPTFPCALITGDVVSDIRLLYNLCSASDRVTCTQESCTLPPQCSLSNRFLNTIVDQTPFAHLSDLVFPCNM